MENGHLSPQVRPEPDSATKVSPTASPEVRKPRMGLLGIRLPLIPMLGLLFLCFLFGAATMFYQLPTSGFLSKGFMGARAWAESHIEIEQSEVMRPVSVGIVDQPGKTYDGYTL